MKHGLKKCVRITNGKQKILLLNDHPICLYLLSSMLYKAIHNKTNKGFNLNALVDYFCNSGQWPKIDIPPNSVPNYPIENLDEILNFQMHCETWGFGVIELFLKNNTFAHVGFQLGIKSAFLLGTKRREERCINEVVSFAKDNYGSPITHKPLQYTHGAMIVFSDDMTHCYIISDARPIPLITSRPVPLITFRLWNRKMWDPELDV